MEIFRVAPVSAAELRQRRWRLVPAFAVSAGLSLACFHLMGRYAEGCSFPDLIKFIMLQIGAIVSLIVALVLALVFFVLPRMNRRTCEQEFELTNEGLSRYYPNLPDMFVPANEIVSFERRINGLFLHLKKQPKILRIPARLSGLDHFQEKLLAMGISETRPGWFRRYRGILLISAYVVSVFFCLAVFFASNDPITVAIAGIGYIAFLAWAQYNRPRGSHYKRPYPSTAYKLQFVTLALWVFVVALHVWKVADKRYHPHHHTTQASSQTR